MVSSFYRKFQGIFKLAVLVVSFYSLSAYGEALPRIETFFQNKAFSGAELSPNGKFVAARIASPGKRAVLAVLDIETLTPIVVASYEDVDIGTFHWVNDERLVYDTTDLKLPPGERYGGPGLFGVNKDGSRYKQLVHRYQPWLKVDDSGRELLPWKTFLYSTTNLKNTNDVFVIQPSAISSKVFDYVDIYRLNTMTGHMDAVQSPLRSQNWIFDEKDQLKIVQTFDEKMTSLQYFDAEKNTWRKLQEFNFFQDEGMNPEYYDSARGLYVQAYNGNDKAAIYKFDLNTNKLVDKPIVASPDFDIDGFAVKNKSGILGMRYVIDAEVTQWFDKGMQEVQQTVDTLLPNTINRLDVAWDATTPIVLVTAFSDVQPSIYALFNTQTKKFTKLGQAYPGINPKQMGSKDFVKYKARDGLEIPAYVTIPAGKEKKNLPMVVLVHGGPWVHGSTWEWDREVQFLASRGYVVLEPAFRGSAGYGEKHLKASWKQWGLSMQDDIADGTKWAIAQGIADPKRICIAGASYGGYATLMGLINDPDLYKCGINWVGVTDINLMYSVNWSDFSDAFKKYGMPVRIGDQEKDAAQLKATSPIENAKKVKQPLLLAYGGEDVRVPIVHGKKFYSAVKGTNPNVEWIEYENEAHGWRTLETNVDFWGRVEKFLEKNIGK